MDYYNTVERFEIELHRDYYGSLEFRKYDFFFLKLISRSLIQPRVETRSCSVRRTDVETCQYVNEHSHH